MGECFPFRFGLQKSDKIFKKSELALMRMKANRGDKYLVAVSETARCLGDAIQAATGCTLGHGNAFIDSN